MHANCNHEGETHVNWFLQVTYQFYEELGKQKKSQKMVLIFPEANVPSFLFALSDLHIYITNITHD